MRTPAPMRVPTAVATALAAALLVGCTSSPVPGSALPASDGGVSPTARPGSEADPEPSAPSDAPRDRENACRVTLSGRGNIQVNGGGTRAVTRNGVTSLACGDGPLVEIEVQDGGVSFTPEGGRAVRVGAGETAQVDDYEVTVEDAAGDRAEFVVVPPA